MKLIIMIATILASASFAKADFTLTPSGQPLKLGDGQLVHCYADPQAPVIAPPPPPVTTPIPKTFTASNVVYWAWTSVEETHACGYGDIARAKDNAANDAIAQCKTAGFAECDVTNNYISKSGTLDPVNDIGLPLGQANFYAGCVASAVVIGR